ncbi:metal ABC transporter ATP-binding protein [Streptococcus sp. zg-JUN1979]|uniref:metal ABC transporter ATP-binding protein n=1 Tax=Streptococcus sp. zg-JUN1979 TaxID=3391450 RepID=UPI0039B01FD5
MKNELVVNHLSYVYENGEGIHDVSFALESGDFLAIIGKSGAGKSTLINTVLGILPAVTGEVLISDHLSAKDISFTPQSQAIDWYLTVFDNVYMGALFSGSRHPKKDTMAILKKIGLAGKENEDPTDLSGGQLQRVQLARQLVSNAEILILDEPTASLDVITSEKILDQLSRQTRAGKICLISSHDLDMLEQYCNKVLYIEDGQLQFFGLINDFVKRYNRSSEYYISYEGHIPEATKVQLTQTCHVLDWHPLRVDISDLEKLNHLLCILLDNHVRITGIEQKSCRLKEIIQLQG